MIRTYLFTLARNRGLWVAGIVIAVTVAYDWTTLMTHIGWTSAGEWGRQLVGLAIFGAPLIASLAASNILVADTFHQDISAVVPTSRMKRLLSQGLAISLASLLMLCLAVVIGGFVRHIIHHRANLAMPGISLAGIRYIPVYALFAWSPLWLWSVVSLLTGPSRHAPWRTPLLVLCVWLPSWLGINAVTLLYLDLAPAMREVLHWLHPMGLLGLAPTEPVGIDGRLAFLSRLFLVSLGVWLVAIARPIQDRRSGRPSSGWRAVVVSLGTSTAVFAVGLSVTLLVFQWFSQDSAAPLFAANGSRARVAGYATVTRTPGPVADAGAKDLVEWESNKWPGELAHVRDHIGQIVQRAVWMTQTPELKLLPYSLSLRAAHGVRTNHAIWLDNETIIVGESLARLGHAPTNVAAALANSIPLNVAGRAYVQLWLAEPVYAAKRLLTLMEQLVRNEDGRLAEQFVWLHPADDLGPQRERLQEISRDLLRQDAQQSWEEADRDADIARERRHRALYASRDRLDDEQRFATGQVWFRPSGYEAWLILQYWQEGERIGHETFIKSIITNAANDRLP